MATIRDVAREANVSAATVSLVLNARGNVRASTRKRVESAAQKLQYKVVGDVAGQETEAKILNIGVLYGVGAVSNGQVSMLSRAWMNGVRNVVIQSQHHFSVYGGRNHVDRDLLFQQSIDSGDVDGIIAIGMTPEDGYLNFLLSRKLPMVVVGPKPKYCEYSYIEADACGGGVQAVRYLSSLGHRRIAFAAEGKDYDYRIACGIKQGIEENGVEGVLLDCPDWQKATDEDIHKLVDKFIAEKVTAAYLVSEPIAIRCIDNMQSRGISVPGDFSILGWDDSGFVTKSGMRLTCVGFDKEKMGRAAAEMLQKLIDENSRHDEAGVQNMAISFKTFVGEKDTVAKVQEIAGK